MKLCRCGNAAKYARRCVQCHRKAKREWMARDRTTPAGRVRQNVVARRAYANGGLARQRARKEEMKGAQWFKWREQFVRRTEPDITAVDIEAIWQKQDGRCALTGEALTKANAHLDHIIPVVRGGRGLGLANLRWVTKAANLAKRDLTDEEFYALCSTVIAWLGRRLMEVSHG